MTEIHAFDPDGTPSPGAQTALDAATAGLATQADISSATNNLASQEDVGEAVQGLASRTELTAAINAIPDADATQRGLMTPMAVKTLSDVVAPPLSRRVLRAALEGQRTTGVGVIFAGSSTIQGDKATSTDRRPVQRISAYQIGRAHV